MSVLVEAQTWVRVAEYADLEPEHGVAALVDGVQIAIFRTHDGAVYALSNRDPFTGAQVISRGIVGTRGDAPTVASPLHKQVFDLRTGGCFDDPALALTVFAVRIRDGAVEVGAP